MIIFYPGIIFIIEYKHATIIGRDYQDYFKIIIEYLVIFEYNYKHTRTQIYLFKNK